MAPWINDNADSDQNGGFVYYFLNLESSPSLLCFPNPFKNQETQDSTKNVKA